MKMSGTNQILIGKSCFDTTVWLKPVCLTKNRIYRLKFSCIFTIVKLLNWQIYRIVFESDSQLFTVYFEQISKIWQDDPFLKFELNNGVKYVISFISDICLIDVSDMLAVLVLGYYTVL